MKCEGFVDLFLIVATNEDPVLVGVATMRPRRLAKMRKACILTQREEKNYVYKCKKSC